MPAANPDSNSSSDPDAANSDDPEFPDSRHVFEANCTRCQALSESRECISWGTGSLDASVLVVGEAPGHGHPDADRWRGGNWTGKAYTSRHSGRRIRRMLDRVGYGDDAYYTNAVKCFPASEEPRSSTASGETGSADDRATNREPTAEERANCRPHLLSELETVDPTVVLATGKHATKTVLAAEGRDLEGFIDSVLEPIYCEELEIWLVPILHPSYQDIWIGRLGYEPADYLEGIRETIEGVLE
ncbi:uracil-DNA glycosylase [Natrialba aegyptia]|uniref:Uracil-DNA glycosylase n=1 Tax=Natrialba aegyptia DSM 13077 TaxID=1227491 RepID=M0BAA7_9EURY|nr:uracil-DNA glycosylase [Natrialba aegyptia]ELZ06569.1 uracil-DNA glycosylase [Natrialba aegyptia DSM 13077]